jgi:stringent starvation protein B
MYNCLNPRQYEYHQSKREMSRKLTPIRPSAFDAASVQFDALKKHELGSKFVDTRYKRDGKKSILTVQTGKLPVIGGVKKWEAKKEGDNPKFTLGVSLRGNKGSPIIKDDDGNQILDEKYDWDAAYEEEPAQQALYRFSTKYSNLIRDTVRANLIPWWKMNKAAAKKMKDNEDKIREKYKDLHRIKQKNTEQGDLEAVYPPSFSFKVPFYDRNYNKKTTEKKWECGTKFYDENRQEIEDITPENVEEVVPAGSQVKILFQISRWWMVDGTLSAPMTAVAVIVYPPEDTGCAFLPDSDDDSDDNEDDGKSDEDDGKSDEDEDENGNGDDEEEEEEEEDDDDSDED